MKMYADSPVRRTVQIVGDLLLVAWLVLWVWVGTNVHDATLELAGPAARTQSAATDLAENLQDAGDRLGDVPLVGDEAAGPFESASESATGLARAGERGVEAVESLAFWLGVSIAAAPILVVAAFYVPPRLRFARAATAGQRFVDSGEDLDLFAVRALTRQPLHVLARISDDPAGAWRAGDPQVIRALATVELRSTGLRPPPS
jgi:hypothetical protein